MKPSFIYAIGSALIVGNSAFAAEPVQKEKIGLAVSAVNLSAGSIASSVGAAGQQRAEAKIDKFLDRNQTAVDLHQARQPLDDLTLQHLVKNGGTDGRYLLRLEVAGDEARLLRERLMQQNQVLQGADGKWIVAKRDLVKQRIAELEHPKAAPPLQFLLEVTGKSPPLRHDYLFNESYHASVEDQLKRQLATITEDGVPKFKVDDAIGPVVRAMREEKASLVQAYHSPINLKSLGGSVKMTKLKNTRDSFRLIKNLGRFGMASGLVGGAALLVSPAKASEQTFDSSTDETAEFNSSEPEGASAEIE